VERIEKLDPKQLYGFAFHSLDGWKYLSSWLLFVSSYVWDKIDKFDEALYPMWFEDADYSIRCTKADIPLSLQEREDWGFQHLEDERIKERKQKINTHIMERRANRNYVRRKHGL